MAILENYALNLEAYTQVSSEAARLMAYFVAGMSSSIKIDGMNTNTNLLLVGPSSVSHKSTLARKALESFYGGVTTLGTLFSVETAVLSNANLGYTVFYEDEIGLFLKRVKGGSAAYKGVVDMFNSLYDGKTYCFPRRGNNNPNTIKDHKVGLVACTTMESMKAHCTPELLEGGFMKRMMVIFLGNHGYKSRRDRQALNTRLPVRCQPSKEVTFDAKVWKSHDHFMEERIGDKNESIAGMWQRAEDNIFKLAAIDAVYGNDMSSVVKMPNWTTAIKMVEASISAQIALVEMLKNA